MLTFDEAKLAALEKRIYLYDKNALFDTSKRNLYEFIDVNLKHIGEIRITRDDGTLYYFGLPVYNTEKKEVAFNISGKVNTAFSKDTDLVSYNGIDNSINNNNGANNYFSTTSIPPYAYAYLLTAIISPDYVDLTGDGPTSDDLGTYTKFNYTKNENTKWRTPVEPNKAYFEKGLITRSDDDMANYTYGEKEVFSLHSIETRNYIAEFKISPRTDMHGVSGEDGGLDTNNKSMRLDSIILFSKSDRLQNKEKAIPIKTVRFKYSYDLCKKHPAVENSQGKLTLKSIVTSYKNSKKEMYSPYNFTYSSFNPDYAIRNTDRWGTYKRDKDDSFPFDKQFYFTPQSKDSADLYVTAWKLTEINNPAGGTLKIFYESDDYGYVQDKKAMQMFRISGLSNSSSFSNSNVVYTSSGDNLYIFFDLIEGIKKTGHAEDSLLLKEYFSGIHELFFQVNSNILAGGPNEAIKGFARLQALKYASNYGFVENAGSSFYRGAWVKLDLEKGYDTQNGFHPFANAAFDFIRNNDPDIQPTLVNDEFIFEDVIEEFANFARSVGELTAGGFNNSMRQNLIASKIELNKSFIRLNNPVRKKIGGGARVKSIELHDNWNKMALGRDSFHYGTQYEYTTVEKIGGSDRLISSGVATYEPMLGAEENPFFLPSRYNVSFPVFMIFNTSPVESKMDFLPYGEYFYPSPSVGYSNIKIRNLRRANVKSNATGFIEKQFYTSRDFPLSPLKSDAPKIERFKIPPIPLPLFQLSIDFLTVVQNHVFELNDMNGKPKAEWVYSESDSLNPVSGMEYKYKRQSSNGPLANKMKVADKNGNVSDALIGIEYDFVADEREYSSLSGSFNVQANIDVIQTLVPTPVPMVWPSAASESTIFRTFSTTKTIMRSGILEKVIAHDKGATTTTTNEIFDAQTGMVVVTSSNNEFGDKIYTYNIPAHWKYDGMGQASVNTGFELPNISLNNGNVTDPLCALFTKGDEVLISRGNDRKGWVIDANLNSIKIINDTGALINAGNVDLKIIRSGRRNMQNLTVGTIVTKEDLSTQNPINPKNEILHAEATEFSDRWQTYAGFNIETQKYECECEKTSGCKFSSLRTLVQLGLDSLQESKTFDIKFNKNNSFFKALAAPGCWGGEIIHDSTVIHFEVSNRYLTISVKNKNETTCEIELYNQAGFNLGRQRVTCAIDTIVFDETCNNSGIMFRLKLKCRYKDNTVQDQVIEGKTKPL